MSQVCDRVYDRLRQLKDERRELRMADFADLELEGDTVYRCLQDLEAERLVTESIRPRLAAQGGRRVVADVFFYITDEGREQFENED